MVKHFSREFYIIIQNIFDKYSPHCYNTLKAKDTMLQRKIQIQPKDK